jgi:hypothetical protein
MYQLFYLKKTHDLLALVRQTIQDALAIGIEDALVIRRKTIKYRPAELEKYPSGLWAEPLRQRNCKRQWNLYRDNGRSHSIRRKRTYESHFK